jgi:hypothetical protein
MRCLIFLEETLSIGTPLAKGFGVDIVEGRLWSVRSSCHCIDRDGSNEACVRGKKA